MHIKKSLSRKNVASFLLFDEPSDKILKIRIIAMLPVLFAYVLGYILLEYGKRVIDYFAFHLIASHLKEFSASRKQGEVPCRVECPNPTKFSEKIKERGISGCISKSIMKKPLPL